MTRDELTAAISGLVTNPDTAAANAPGIIEAVSGVYDTMDAMTKERDERDKKIRDLQDSNIKLFLAQTGNPGGEPDPEDEPESLEDLAKKLLGRE